jgi:NTP pyrophosphatase (non-canonical NTP hydrolase)
MTTKEYQEWILTKAKQYSDGDIRLVANALGVAGEAGEFGNKVKKQVFHEHGVDREVLLDELGDILFYVGELANAIGVSFDDIIENNVTKLNKRYPQGFSPQRSINRKE